MIQVIYFVLRQYIKTAPKGPLPDGCELLLISIPPSISSSQVVARIAPVPAAQWAWWWCRGIPLPVVSYLIHHCSGNTAFQRLISAVCLFYFLIVYSWQWLRHCEVFWLSQLCPKEAFLLPLPRFQYLDHRISLTAAVEIGWIFMIPTAEGIVCLH